MIILSSRKKSSRCFHDSFSLLPQSWNSRANYHTNISTGSNDYNLFLCHKKNLRERKVSWKTASPQSSLLHIAKCSTKPLLISKSLLWNHHIVLSVWPCLSYPGLSSFPELRIKRCNRALRESHESRIIRNECFCRSKTSESYLTFKINCRKITVFA